MCDPPHCLIIIDVSRLGRTEVDSRIDRLGLRIYIGISHLRFAPENRNLPCRRLNGSGPDAAMASGTTYLPWGQVPAVIDLRPR